MPSEGSATSGDPGNSASESRIRPDPPNPSSDTDNFKNCGVRIVHEVAPEDSVSNRAARASKKAANPTAPANDQNNDLAVQIRNTKTFRGLGVFTRDDFTKHHTIIKEQPTLSCAIPVERDAASWRRRLAERWCSLAWMHQEMVRSQFVKMRQMPSGVRELTSRQSKDLLAFIKEYAFRNPPRTMMHVYRWSSHINHACRSCANAEVWIEPSQPNRISVRLVRDVKKGEELFICYNRASDKSLGCAVCGPGGSKRVRIKLFCRRVVGWFARRPPLEPLDVQNASPRTSYTASTIPTTDVATNLSEAAAETEVTTDTEVARDVDATPAAEITMYVNAENPAVAAAARAPVDAEDITKPGAQSHAEVPNHDTSSEPRAPLRRRAMTRFKAFLARAR
ncbi:hypothetical protein V8C35DRAFT_278333 [Trichoderma chlorosporum]